MQAAALEGELKTASAPLDKQAHTLEGTTLPKTRSSKFPLVSRAQDEARLSAYSRRVVCQGSARAHPRERAGHHQAAEVRVNRPYSPWSHGTAPRDIGPSSSLEMMYRRFIQKAQTSTQCPLCDRHFDASLEAGKFVQKVCSPHSSPCSCFRVILTLPQLEDLIANVPKSLAEVKKSLAEKETLHKVRVPCFPSPRV